MAVVSMLSAIADQKASQVAGAVSALMPSGVVLPFGGTAAPTGWLLCDGSAISRTVYAELFAAIGTTHGIGDGIDTFNLPDMRGVFPRGAGTNGTSNYGGVTGHTPAGGSVGAKGGQKTAKNGLGGSSGNQSANHSHSAEHNHGSQAASVEYGGTHAHWIIYDYGTPPNQYLTWNGGPGSLGGPELSTVYSPADNNTVVKTDSQGYHNHSASVDLPNLDVTTGSNSVNHTHTVAISSGDTETTPAALALNYIIKV